ncbi:helix-turn-helix domain-containing protein [Hoeflea sp.]|uniref:helix-turn-helix domain-containing protein n=1 Tax=Hoeflea sp. TaxID=1940281 RepID=UPI003A9408F5
MSLLTEPEVADRLRCSTEKVKRLRLSGNLAYHKGRPVLINEKDLNTYLETIRQPTTVKRSPDPDGETKPHPPKQAGGETAAARARRKWLTRRLKG